MKILLAIAVGCALLAPISAAALCALGTKREDPPRSGPAHKVSDKEALADYASRGRDLMRELDEANRPASLLSVKRVKSVSEWVAA